MYDAVFIGKFPNEKIILKLINPGTYEIPIVNYIISKNPRIKLSMITLNNTQFEDNIDLFDSSEIPKSTNIYLIVFEYIEGDILANTRTIASCMLFQLCMKSSRR